MEQSRTNVGGQAVLEGVMMRSPRCFAVAVRRKAGTIVIREQPWKSAWANKVAKVPFVRGAITLFESLSNGYSALRFSAEQMEEDLAAEEATSQANEAPDASPSEPYRGRVDDAGAPVAPSGGSASGAGTRLATVIAILFFIALPQLLAWAVGRFFGPGLGLQDFGFHALTGAFKLTLILGYLSLIRRVPEVRRVFQYHGAEHKAIATYEAREPLTVEYARKHSTRHARCGTTFIIVVVLVSVFAYAAILPPILKGITGATAQLLAIGIKILMLPLIAGFAYELHQIQRAILEKPARPDLPHAGYWVQGITTIDPTDDQLEIALASLRVTLVRENEAVDGVGTTLNEPVVQTYPSYTAFATAYGGLRFNG